MPTPVTVLEILNKTSDFFKSKGIDNPVLDAQLILAQALGMKRIDLYLNYDRPFKEEELNQCREWVQRRAKREPLQHVLGVAHFRNLVLTIDKRALIPRQETELLVDSVIKAANFLKAEAVTTSDVTQNPLEILEIGVGSGAIFLSLCKELSDVLVDGVDISQDALALAIQNARHMGCEDAVNRLKQGDLFSPYPIDKQWDIIVSNPPYIGRVEWPQLQPEVKNWDPETALIGGLEGFELPMKLITESFQRLRQGGYLLMEIGETQSELLLQSSLPWREKMVHRDYSDKNRFLWFRK